uniref:Uncharacterized protein n=1 Tax=Aegilops tauschii subsp. strangulata TaxID=200361 RepID=A0A453PG76_AEGTS
MSDAELKLQLDMPPNSILLSNCEAAEMLQKIQGHMAILSEDPTIKIPESFDKAFQYAKEGNHFTSAKLVKEILEPLKDYGVNDGEVRKPSFPLTFLYLISLFSNIKRFVVPVTDMHDSKHWA